MTPSTANNIFVLLENLSQWEHLDTENPSFARINSNYLIFKSQTSDKLNLNGINETFGRLIEVVRRTNLDNSWLKENKDYFKTLQSALKLQITSLFAANIDNPENHDLQKRFFRDSTWYYLTLFIEKKGHMMVLDIDKHTTICKQFDSLYSELFSDESNDSFELFELFNEAKGYLQYFRNYHSFVTKSRLSRNFEETLIEIREFLISELVGHTENETNKSLSSH